MGEEQWAPGQSCSMLRDRMGLGFSCFPFLGCDFFCFSLLVVGGPTMTGKAGLVPWKRLYIKHLPPTASAAAEPRPWPFGLHVAGYQIHEYTHTGNTHMLITTC